MPSRCPFRVPTPFAALLLAAVPLVAAVGPRSAEGGTFRAGAAAVDVSPRDLSAERPAIVAGGFLEGRADRVHDPLLVRAIVLDDGGGGVEGREPVRLALVVVDSCMMPRSLLDEAKRLAEARTGIPASRMMVSATHTHSAPAALACLGTRVDEPYAAMLPGRIAAAIAAANDRLEPAAIGVGAVEDWTHTHNRRWVRRPETRVVDPFGNPTGLAHMHPGHLSKEVIGPSGPVDPQLSVVSVRAASGKPLAVLANYSQHYFGSPAVSADYFGHFARRVAEALGEAGEGNGPFVCALSQGTSGDLMWMDYGAAPASPSVQEYAAAVAAHAVEAISRVAHRDDVTLAIAERELDLAYRVPDAARLAWAKPIAAGIPDDLPRNIPEVYAREALILHERQRTKILLQAIRIGEATIACLPNEVYALTGLRLRSRSPASLHFNVELANGGDGYIPPPEQHVLGGYTTWPARTAGLEVEAEPKIVEALSGALEEVTGKPRRTPAAPPGPAAEAVLLEKPAGYWRCDEDEGSALDNSVPGAPPATLAPGFARYLPGVGAGSGVGAESRLRGGVFAAPGTINRAVHLAGATIELPPAAPAGDATLVCWVWLGERSGASRREGVVCRGLSAEPLVAHQDESHSLVLALGEARTDLPLRADDWHQVALVRRGDRVRVHVDGAAEPCLEGEAGRGPIVIGEGLQGKVDEIALFDRALEKATIAALEAASGMAAERRTKEARSKAAEAREARLAGFPELPPDHGTRVAALGPVRTWALGEKPTDLAVAGAVDFHPRGRAAFRAGRLSGASSALGSDWSVAFWFRSDVPPESRPVAAYLFSRGPAGAAGAPGDHLGIAGSAIPGGSGKLILFDGNDKNGLLVGDTVVPPGTWNHVVLVRRGEEATVWLNGRPEPEIDGTLEVTATESRDFFLGARSDDFAPLAGRMAEVTLFDRPLDAAEAAALFAASAQEAGKPLPVAVEEEGPRSPEETRLGIRVPRGYRVELVASEPDVLDPVAFDWDSQGRLWVVEMADYPSGMDGAGRPGGRVRLLWDRDGDGRYESSRLFADGLSFPNGIAVWKDGVIVTAAPQIVHLRDTDGDGICDARETILEGFMEGNQQLRVNGLRLGLDGLLWCASGGHHPGHGTETVITERRHGRQYTLGSHDFRFLPASGAVWIESGPSQFGRNRDPFGHWFGTQNANPLWHWVIPERFAARNPAVAPERTTRHVMGASSPPVRPASTPEKRFHSFGEAGRFTSACGATIDLARGLFPGGRAPEELHAFVCEPFHNLVQHAVLADDGPSFTSRWPEEEGPTDFFASDDRWCRPVMTRIGPDGALWIADMYRAMIEHPDWLPPEGRAEMLPKYRLGDDRGRIWRVVRDDVPPPRFPEAVRAAGTGAELAALFDSHVGWQRDHAMRRVLFESPDAVQAEAAERLRELVSHASLPETRAQALAALVRMGRLPEGLLLEALADRHPRVREVAVVVASEMGHSREVRLKVCDLATDPDAKVRLQVALSCGEWNDPEAAAALTSIAIADAADPLFRTAVMTSAVPHVQVLSRAVAAADPAVADVYRESILPMAVARRDGPIVSALLDAALAVPEGIRPGWLEPLLADMQRAGADPWGMNVVPATLSALERELARAEDLAADADESPERRLAAARLLARTERTRDRSVTLLSEWLVPRTDPEVQLSVLDALARSEAAGVPDALAGAWPGLGPASRSKAIDVWLSRPEWTADLLDRIESGLLAPGSLSLPQRDQLLGRPDASVAARARELLAGGATAARRDVVAAYAAALEGEGDGTKGRDVYLRVCAACHRRGPWGHDVGPNLATVIEHAPERLLANILDPSADIQPGSQASTCVLTSGEVVAGIVAAEAGGSVTMKLADGTTRNIARADIEELVTSNRSFMPEGVEETVSVEQMRDLLAFLRGEL